MRLTTILFRRNRLPNGLLFRGKDRLVRKVEPFHMRNLVYNYQIEEANMLLLRHPYLTKEQSFGHAKALGKHEAYINNCKDKRQNKFKEHVTLEDRLMHLRVQDRWD